MRTGSYAWEVVGTDIEVQNQLDVICAEHSIETAWTGEKQFLFEIATQFGKDCSRWIEISGWSTQRLYDYIGY